ncbi:hypothetical protein E4T44_12480, partial [Aureobasidium sp. EXF-8845]
AVTPVNYLLFGCHFVNFGAQVTQGYRYLNYWNFGGKELRDKATQEMSHIADQAKSAAHKVEGQAKAAAHKVESKAKEVANKVNSS